jgi:hypothetical protein
MKGRCTANLRSGQCLIWVVFDRSAVEDGHWVVTRFTGGRDARACSPLARALSAASHSSHQIALNTFPRPEYHRARLGNLPGRPMEAEYETADDGHGACARSAVRRRNGFCPDLSGTLDPGDRPVCRRQRERRDHARAARAHGHLHGTAFHRRESSRRRGQHRYGGGRQGGPGRLHPGDEHTRAARRQQDLVPRSRLRPGERFRADFPVRDRSDPAARSIWPASISSRWWESR